MRRACGSHFQKPALLTSVGAWILVVRDWRMENGPGFCRYSISTPESVSTPMLTAPRRGKRLQEQLARVIALRGATEIDCLGAGVKLDFIPGRTP